MVKRVIINEDELKRVMRDSVVHAIQENRIQLEIKLAQKELYQMSDNLSSIGMRLQGTKYEPLYSKMKNAIIKLNNALIKDIRRDK